MRKDRRRVFTKTRPTLPRGYSSTTIAESTISESMQIITVILKMGELVGKSPTTGTLTQHLPSTLTQHLPSTLTCAHTIIITLSLLPSLYSHPPPPPYPLTLTHTTLPPHPHPHLPTPPYITPHSNSPSPSLCHTRLPRHTSLHLSLSSPFRNCQLPRHKHYGPGRR